MGVQELAEEGTDEFGPSGGVDVLDEPLEEQSQRSVGHP